LLIGSSDVREDPHPKVGPRAVRIPPHGQPARPQPVIHKLIIQKEGVISSEQAADLRRSYTATLDADLGKVDEYKPNSDMLQGKWSKLVWPNSDAAKHELDTGVDRELLTEVAKASVALPDNFVSIAHSAQADMSRTSTRDSSVMSQQDSKAWIQRSISPLRRPWPLGR